MEGLIDDLGKLFLSLEGLDPKTDKALVPSFVLGCAIMGVLALILDISYKHVTGESFLNLKHGPIRSIPYFITWPVGSAIFGFLGLIAHVLQPAILGCAAAGLTWTLSMKRVTDRLKAGTVAPEDDPADEGE